MKLPWETRLDEAPLACCGHGASSHCATCRRCHAPAERGACACVTGKPKRIVQPRLYSDPNVGVPA